MITTLYYCGGLCLVYFGTHTELKIKKLETKYGHCWKIESYQNTLNGPIAFPTIYR